MGYGGGAFNPTGPVGKGGLSTPMPRGDGGPPAQDGFHKKATARAILQGVSV